MDTRLLALEALWKGPTAFVLDDGRSWEIEFTLDGQWLVQATDETPFQMTVFGADGSVSPLQDVHDAWVDLVMDTSSGYFATLPAGNDESWALWSAPEKRLLAQKGPSAPFVLWGAVVDSTLRRVVVVIRDGDEIRVETFSFDGEHKRLGALPFTTRRDDTGGFSTIAVLEPASGRRLFVLRDHAVYVFEVGDKELGSSKRLDHIEATVANHGIAIDPRGRFIAARHQDGLIRIWDLHGKASPIIIPEPPGVSSLGLARDGSLLEAKKFENNEVTTWVWSLEGEQPRLLRRNDLGINGAIAGWTLDPVERRLVSILNPDSKIRLWPLSAPEDAEPVVMQRGVGGARRVRIHPNGQWLASSFTNGLTVWPLSRRYPIVIDRYEDWKVEAAFGPRGEWLATTSVDSAGTVRLWQLEGDNLPAGRVLAELDTYAYGLAVSPHGKSLLVGSHSQGAQLLSLDGRPPRRLPGDETYAGSTAISQDGRLGAASSVQGSTGYIHIWNLETVETFSVIELSSGMGEAPAIRFAADHWLLAGSDFGLVRLDTETGERETIYDGRIAVLDVSGDGSLVIFTSPGEDATSGTLAPLGRAIVLDLETRAATTLEAHGDRVVAVALDPSGDFVVTGDLDGVIRVGPLDGREPHLLLGSPGEVFDLAVDPKGRWIASTGGNELRLWPMPDLSKPPLHTLPRDELIAKLKTLTNIRVVRDEESATGWKLTHDPFPGWETVPTW
jgi:WD40 repeat protein